MKLYRILYLGIAFSWILVRLLLPYGYFMPEGIIPTIAVISFLTLPPLSLILVVIIFIVEIFYVLKKLGNTFVKINLFLSIICVVYMFILFNFIESSSFLYHWIYIILYIIKFILSFFMQINPKEEKKEKLKKTL
jgi:hypothetical protein